MKKRNQDLFTGKRVDIPPSNLSRKCRINPQKRIADERQERERLLKKKVEGAIDFDF
jgi:hypothetical protein